MGSAEASGAQLTRILNAWSTGDRAALERLTGLVYSELHRIAEQKMAAEQRGHLLQPSALVNEAFLRLLADTPVDWQNRAHFFARSAGIMRHILVDYARKQHMPRADLSSIANFAASKARPLDFLDVEAALEALAELDPRQAHIVEMRYYGGLSIAEVAVVLGLSDATVNRDWQTARAWLFKRLQPKSIRK